MARQECSKGNRRGFQNEPCDANPRPVLLTAYSSFAISQHGFIFESEVVLLISICSYIFTC